MPSTILKIAAQMTVHQVDFMSVFFCSLLFFTLVFITVAMYNYKYIHVDISGVNLLVCDS